MSRQDSDGLMISSTVESKREKPNFIRNLRWTFRNRDTRMSTHSVMSSQSMPGRLPRQNPEFSLFRNLRRNRSSRGWRDSASGRNIGPELPLAQLRHRPALPNTNSDSMRELERKAFGGTEEFEMSARDDTDKSQLADEPLPPPKASMIHRLKPGRKQIGKMSSLQEEGEDETPNSTKVKMQMYSLDRDELDALFGSEASLFVVSSGMSKSEEQEENRNVDDARKEDPLEYSGHHLLESWGENRFPRQIDSDRYLTSSIVEDFSSDPTNVETPGDGLLVDWGQ